MSSYSVAVEVCIRTILMIALVVLTTLFNGLPNINFLILMIFLSSVLPLPTKTTISAVEVFIPRIFVLIRFWLKASLWLLTILLHPFMVVLNFLFFTVLEEGLQRVVDIIRNASRFLSRTVIGYGLALFFVHFQMMALVIRVVSSVHEWIHVIMTIFRYTRRISFVISDVLCRSAIVHWALENVFKTREVIKIILMLSLVFLVFPGPVAIGNYLVTGHFHPGSVLRVKSWLAQEPEPLYQYSSFLDNCFSSWTALRTAHFFIMTQALAYTSWTPTTHFMNLRRRFNSRYTVAMVISVGLITVVLFDNYVISQLLHVVVGVGSLAMFVLVLDGYHQYHYLLTVYGLGTLMVITQDALVVAYEVFATINATRSINLSLVTVGCLTLWTCCSISIDVSRRILRKIINPSKSIL